MSGWILGIVGGLLVLAAPFMYLSLVLSWGVKRSRGLEYYGARPEQRDRFRRRLAFHARILRPVIRFVARFSTFGLEQAGFKLDDMRGPNGTCTPDSFRRGLEYTSGPEDVFVVTQMKCGTTWMQNIVYEVLMRGDGDLVDTGTTLYAVSPWLEAETGVPVADAPLIGAGPRRRIIKTHFAADACPRHPDARYVYVARDPVSCFASCRDFLATNMGPFCPETPEIADWFASDEMWWGPWPAHVAGWWRRARTDDNVLFVRFEDMFDDPEAVVRMVADFLDVPALESDALAKVLRKTGFEYMKRHRHTFEMHPPHLIAADPDLFVRGTRDRFSDVSPELDRRIMEWCRDEMQAEPPTLDALYTRGAAPLGGTQETS